MASQPMALQYQSDFNNAVKTGNRVCWQNLLACKKQDPGFPLNIQECLFDTLYIRNTDALKDVLNLHPNLNIKNHKGETPLHIVAKVGPPEHIRILLEAGSLLNQEDQIGFTPLHTACRFNNFSTAEVLLSEGAYASTCTIFDSVTPLVTAVSQNFESIVELLMRNWADPNFRAITSDKNPLHLAIRSKSVRIVKALLSTGADIEYFEDACGNYPLHQAVQIENVDILNLLLSNLTHFRLKQNATNGQTEMQTELVNLCNNRNMTALHLAIQSGLYMMVKLLLEAGADYTLSYGGQQPLELAISFVQPLGFPDQQAYVHEGSHERRRRVAEGALWDEEIVLLLCQQRDVNLDKVTPDGLYLIHLALDAGLYRAALFISIRVPNSVDCADAMGRTPLHLACCQKSEDRSTRLNLIRTLLDLGLSVNARTWDKGYSPLSFAVHQGDLEIVTLLLECMPDLRGVDLWGCTALHDAVVVQNLPIVEALVAAGSEVNCKDCEGKQTPLILAATIGAVEVAKFLLCHGAQIDDVETRMGHSALNRAIHNFCRKPDTYLHMIRLLVMSGADLDVMNSTHLTPIQMMLHAMVCRCEDPKVIRVGLEVVKLLAEAGSTLVPWVPVHPVGVLRKAPLLSLAYTNQCRITYYLANVGWKLIFEVPTELDANGENRIAENHWMKLPGKTEAQDSLHGYLMLRMANPFSLQELCRTAIRSALQNAGRARRGDRRNPEILTSVERLPLPLSVRNYLSMQDRDYSNVEECWGKLLHLLPPSATDIVSELAQTDDHAADSSNTA